MVLTRSIPLEATSLEDLSRAAHQNMAKLMLATGMIVAYSYAIEAFISGSANEFEFRCNQSRGWTLSMALLGMDYAN
jgi:hypothetical protein